MRQLGFPCVNAFNSSESVKCRTNNTKPILLSDGNLWTFPLPSLRLSPVFTGFDHTPASDREPLVVRRRIGHSLKIEQARMSIEDGLECESSVTLWTRFFTLATELLRELHPVNLSTCTELLLVSESELPRLLREVIDLFHSTSQR